MIEGLALTRTIGESHPRARLHAPVIGPQHPRGDASERAPAFGDPLESRRVGAALEAQGELGGFLKREVAGRKGVRVAEAEQEENVRRPRPHALDRDQRLVGVLGVEIAEALEVEAALDLRLGDRPSQSLLRIPPQASLVSIQSDEPVLHGYPVCVLLGD